MWLSLGQRRIHSAPALGTEWYSSVLTAASSSLANSADIAQMLGLCGSQQMAPPSLQVAGCCPVCKYYGHDNECSLLEQNRGRCLFLSTVECLKADMAVYRQPASTSAAASPVQDVAIQSVSAPHVTFTHALRACLMTLKLISLMSSVTGMVDVSVALWYTLDTIGRQFYKRSVVVSEDAEQCQLSLQLTQLVEPIMRKNLKLEDSDWQAEVCCKLLSGCMFQVPRSVTCQAVSRELADTGKSLHESGAVVSL